MRVYSSGGAGGGQASDADLTALSGFTGTGFASRIGSDTWALRTLTAPVAGFTISNPAGISGNPAFALSDDLAALEALSTTGGWAKRTAANTWTLSTPTAAEVGAITEAEADAFYEPIGNAAAAEAAANAYTDAAAATKQDSDPVLDAFVLLSGSGLVIQTSAGGNFALRSVAVSGAGLFVSNADGVAGNPTLSLSGDVQAVEALSGTGIARRTGSNTWSVGTTVSVAEGGTGATDASTARTNLGLAIGSNVQAYDAGLTSLAALPTAADKYAYSTAADTWAEGTITAAGRAILDDADAATQRATLGLTDPAILPQLYVCTSWSNTTQTYSTISGLSFTPVAGGVYEYSYVICAQSSVDTNGLKVQINPGNAVSGSADMRVRGAASNAAVVYNGPISAAATIGTNSPVTPGDRFSATGQGIFKAHASAPTAFTIQAACEEASQTVTIDAGEAILRIRKLN